MGQGFSSSSPGNPGQQGPNFGLSQSPTGVHLPPQSDMYNKSHLNEQGAVVVFGFDEFDVRLGFIRKVYSILMVQLFITLTIIGVILFDENSRRFVMENPWLIWVCFGVTLAIVIPMACCPEVRRKTPTNFIFLFIFTLAEGFIIAIFSSLYSREEVFMAVGVTTLVCLALTIFSFQTKYDFTGMGIYLFVALVVFFFFGLLMMFFPSKGVQLAYSCIGALLFSFYLVYDTQIMIGGKHEFSVSPEEYIFAALNLYLDVINLFIYILRIIGSSRE